MKTVSGTSNGHGLLYIYIYIANTLIADKETSGAGGGGGGWLCNTEGNPHTITL